MQGADSSPEASLFHAYRLCFVCTIKKKQQGLQFQQEINEN